MKTIIKIILFSFLGYNSLAQERINKKLPKIGSQIIGQLNNATGWIYNPEGQWVSRKNRIPVCIDNKDAILIDYEKNALGIDNFISYELRNIKVNNRNYFIFLKRYHTGFYEFPNAEKGWINDKSIDFYVFDSIQFSKINSINFTTEAIIDIYTIYWGSINIQNEISVLNDLEKEVLKQSEKTDEYKGTISQFKLRPYKEGEAELIQFTINLPCDHENDILRCFNKYYYETDKLSLRKLFGPDLHLAYDITDFDRSVQNTNIQKKKTLGDSGVDFNIQKEIKEEHKEEKKEVFLVVEEMPEFPGGPMVLMKYIQNNIQYPKKAKEAGISGKCFLTFVVNYEGTIKDIHMLKGVPGCPECDEEAKKLILAMPKWKPGKKNGKAVDVVYNLPINFQFR
jgi:TonB family protein